MNMRTLILGIITFLIILFGVGGYFLFQRQMVLEDRWHGVKDHIAVTDQKPQVIEKVVSHSQLWRPVQERMKDTVVQIFSQIAATDLLQPYKTPSQGTAYGSGFFINERGDFITNAHVVDQAKAVWIQIPSMGKRIIDAEIVGVSPERDLALLRITNEGLEIIKKELGGVPFLPLGDSDLVLRSDEVLALGYPLGQQSLKSSTGVISGREQHLIQMSAAINPGSSGGPLLNMRGEVVGINAAGFTEAQNVGYAIPINDLKIVLPDLYKIKLLRKPFLGLLCNNASDSLTEFLGNPAPGGCYVVEVVKGSTLEKAGVQSGDMIYEMNGHQVDIFGEMGVPWSEDKISVIDYVSRLSVGEDIHFVVYRKGERKEFSIAFNYVALPTIHKIYPSYEELDYEVFAGMVVMQLTLNHIQILANQAPGLAQYAEIRHITDPVLVVTHIFPNSQVYRTRTLNIGSTLNDVNGIPVSTLEDLRKALKKGMNKKFLTIRASDNVGRTTDNIFIAVEWDKIIKEETRLAQDYKYQMTDTAKDILRVANAQQALDKKDAPTAVS